MIAPLVNYSLKGVIWYQGESNTEAPENYCDLFTRLIADWRGAGSAETCRLSMYSWPTSCPQMSGPPIATGRSFATSSFWLWQIPIRLWP